jgi:dolichyl-diphosphooligosaccharide--protein glycosyltransferase
LAAAAALAPAAALYYVSGRGISNRLSAVAALIVTLAAILVVVFLPPSAGYVFRDKAGALYESVTSRAIVFTSIYVKKPDAGENTPEVYDTITETRRNTTGKILSCVYSSPFLSAACIFSFVVFFVFNWRWMLPLAPALALGLMSFNGANRFVMYLAPFAGAGAGFFITAAVTAAAKVNQTRPKNLFLKKFVRETAAYLPAFLFFIATYHTMGASHMPLPAVPADIYSALTNIRGKLPKDSAVFTWWDFGYAVQEAAGAATFLDGGYQPTGEIHETARALTSPDQRALHAAAIGGIDAGGRTPIDAGGGAPNVYVLFTRDMLEKFPAIYTMAGWDKAGEKDFLLKKGFFSLLCGPIENGVIRCGEYTVDISAGLINGEKPLQNAVVAGNGVVIEEKSYGRSDGLHLEIILKDNVPAYIFILDDEVFSSNINQMYMLGRWDTRLFEETANYYPSARFFKVKKP